MEFRVLGPLEVVADPPVPLRAAKPRTLLAVLLCAGGSPMPVHRLVDVLWGGRPPRTAAENARGYVHQLRRALGDPLRIVRHPAGYELVVAPEEVDAARFERLAERGRAALAAKDAASAARLLRQALDLWRGTPFADVDEVDLLRDEATRLEELRQGALEARVEADLALGGHHDLVAELTGLVARHPFRERLREHLMLALYRAGRQAEALAVARDGRRLLAADLGLEPGPGLRRLEQAILTGDPALCPPPTTARAPAPAAAPLPDTPTNGTPTSGTPTTSTPPNGTPTSGTPTTSTPPNGTPTTSTPPTGTPAPEAAEAPVPAAPAPELPVPRQLPPRSPHFVGRETELDRLSALLDEDGDRGTVVISAIGGTAGIGKTTLAVHWAHSIADRFPDGRLYANLRGFDPVSPPVDPAEVLGGFLDALGVPPERVPAAPAARSALYRSVLADRAVLVVLDNAHDVEQVEPLLPAGSACTAVVTSRNALTGLLARHGARPLTLGVLSRAESLALLSRRLGADRVASQLDAAHDLVDRCAGLPLALAVVAARAARHPGFPLAVLACELADEQNRLDALDTGEPTTSVRTVFSWSLQHVGPEAARLFRLLGLHPGPDIGLPAAADLAGVDRRRARALLTELTEAHLLEERAPLRYTFHDLLRAYANDQARARDPEHDRRAALHRLFDHYLHSAHRANSLMDCGLTEVDPAPPRPDVAPERLADPAAAWSWYEAEHQVLPAAVATALEAGFDTHAWQLHVLLSAYLERRGLMHEWEVNARVAMRAAVRAGDREGEGRVAHGWGRACSMLGRYPEAHTHLRRALDVHRAAGDRVQEANAEYAISWTYLHQDDLPAALRHAERSLAGHTATGNRTGQAKALNMVGWLATKSGDHHRALDHCGRALELHLELGARRNAAHTWDSLGYANHRLGRHAEAVHAYREALARYRELRDDYYEAGTLARLGETLRDMGEVEAARTAWLKAARLIDLLHHHPEAEHVKANLAALPDPA